MISRPWLRKFLGLDSPRPTITRKGRRPLPQVEILEGRLAPAVQMLYGGPGTILELTETQSGATPAVAISEPAINLLTIDLGMGNHFDPSSTGTATGLTYSAATPAASQSATIDLGALNNVSTLQAALAGDTLVLGPIADAVGGLGNVTASAGVIRVAGLDTSHASAGNGNVDLKATGDLTVASNPVLPHATELYTGAGTVSLAADVRADGTGNNGMGALTVQAGAVVTSANPASSAITLRGATVHLDTSANPALVGARRVLGGTATPFVTAGLNGPTGLAFDASGNLYVANYLGNTVSKVAAGSSTATPFVTAGLNGPNILTFDASGNLYVSNRTGNTVSKVAAGSTTATPFVTTGLSGPNGLNFDASGNLYVANEGNNTVSKVAAGSSTATPFVTAGLDGPINPAFDASGNLYVANYNNNTVSKVAAALAPSVGGVVVRSSLPGRPMLLGDISSSVAGINLSSAELADIQTFASGTLTFGDDSQTGDITFRTAQRATTAGDALVVRQAPAGSGRIVLDDEGVGTALDGNGVSVRLVAGAGGIVAANSAVGLVEIATTAAVSLDTAGTAGTAANPLHVFATTLAAHAASGLTLVTQVSQLAADGGSGGVSVRNGGDLTLAALPSLTGVAAAGSVSVRTTGDLLVNANVSNSGPGNVLLQADGSLTVDPAATIQASTGTLALIAGFGVFSTNSVLTVRGSSLLAAAAFLDVGFDAAVTVRLAPGGSTPIALDGGRNGLLELNDEDNATARNFTVTDTTVGWGGPTLTYARLGALTIKGGPGGNTFNILPTSATAVTLVGGTGGDTFRFADGASLTGNIAGGGSAMLDYSAYTTSVVVNLQTGLATGVGGSVSGILNVLGGSAAPAADGTYNLLIGSGGNTLTGGTGRRNILVAGSSASTLVGGDGEDLLIAGFTSYDSDPALANWLQIAAYWAGSDDYSTRAANLSSGTGVALLDATVVTGNGGGNVLSGSGALALIFSDGLDSISGFDPNSQQVAITP